MNISLPDKFSRIPDLPKKLAIGAIFLLVVIISPLVARQFLPAILLAGIVIALPALVFFIRQPGFGFPLLVFAALLVPFSLSTGTQTRINSALLMMMLLTAAWVVKMLIIDRQLELMPQKSIYAGLTLILVTIVSFGFGQLGWYPSRGASLFAQIGQVLIFTFSAVAFILAAQRMQDNRFLKATVFLFIILGGIYAFLFFLPVLRPFANRIFQRAVEDSLFWTWLIALSFGQFWLNKDLKPIIKVFSLGVALVAIFTVFITKQTWASGWLPAAFALFVILFLSKPKIAMAAGLAFIVVLLIRYQLVQNYIFVGDNEYSMLTRLEAWKILFQIIEKNPLFGVGPANYYYFTPYYNILGYSVRFNSHNNYVDLIAQIGFVGLGVFFWWVFEIAKVGFQLLKKPLDHFEHAFVISAIGGLAGTMVAAFLGDWLIPFIYNIGMEGYRSSMLAWVFLGSLIFLYNKYKIPESSR